MRTPEQQERYDSMTDIMASFALEGMQPSQNDLRRVRAYVDGAMTLEEMLADAKAEFGLD